jgi:hypothetical protein
MSPSDRKRLRELIEQLVRDELARLRSEGANVEPPSGGSMERGLIAAADIEAAAKGSQVVRVPQGAIVTPLARDRAKELGVEIKEDLASIE